MSDPICGNCSKPLSEHTKECETYFCYEHTNGDVFTNEPSDEWLLEQIRNYAISINPGIEDALISKWKRDNGHTENLSEVKNEIVHPYSYED